MARTRGAARAEDAGNVIALPTRTARAIDADAEGRVLPAAAWGETLVDLRDGSWIEVRANGVFLCRFDEREVVAGSPRLIEIPVVTRPFSVECATEPADPEGGHGFRLRWNDARGRTVTRVVPAEFVHESGNAFRKWLSSRDIPNKPKHFGALVDYLSLVEPKKRIPCYARTGWQTAPAGGDVFVLHDRVLGGEGDAVFQSLDPNAGAPTRARGKLDDWLERVARPACALGWWRTALLASFAAPLLRPLGEPSRFFHAVGTTSQGKTIGGAVAASVWGKGVRNDTEAFVATWNNTGNALESMAAAHNDVLLVLDEIAEADSKTIKRVVYQLAHGAGRGRQNSNAEMKERRHWRTLVVSTGEQSLGSMIERDGGEISGGLAVRFLELPVASSGMLQRLDDAADVKRLEVAVGQVYGTAGPAFVEWLIARGFGELEHTAILAARQRLDAIEGALLGGVVDPRHRRAGRAFALLQLAGELAIDAGVAPAELDPAGTAALAFKAWLGAAGCDETDDLRAIARKVRDFIVRELDVSISPSGVEPKRTRSGWYAKKNRIGGDDDEGDEITVWLLSGALKAQLNGLPAREWCREAIRRGVLIPGEGERNLTRRVPKGLAPGRPRAHEFILAELEVWAESDEPGADDAPLPF